MPRSMQVGYFLDGSETLEQVVLRLRYGSHDPVMNQIPISSVNCVAKYIHTPILNVRSIIDRFFYAKYEAKGRRKMSVEASNLLTSKQFLFDNSILTLKERAALVGRLFPNESISQSAVQRLYKKNRIKFKKVL